MDKVVRMQTWRVRAQGCRQWERLSLVAAIVLLHAVVLGAANMQPDVPQVLPDEMMVALAQESVQPSVLQAPQPRQPEAQPPRREPPVPQEAAPAEPPATLPSAAPPVENTRDEPVIPDSHPDFQAEYLNNARPPYPLVARRMGYHGKVVLNVEVLAEGRAGQVVLRTSSGHEVLDSSALQTVKGWRFNPARRLGQPVTEWFLVPIVFSLEDGSA